MTKPKSSWERPLPPPEDDTEAQRVQEQFEDEQEDGLQSDDDFEEIPF